MLSPSASLRTGFAKHLRLVLEVLRSVQNDKFRAVPPGGEKRVLRLHLALSSRTGDDVRAGKENQTNWL